VNNHSERATRTIVAIVSFLAMILVGYQLADEYLDLRRQVAEAEVFEDQLLQAATQRQRLLKIEEKVIDQLVAAKVKSIVPNDTGEIRNTLIAIIRDAGGKQRNLEIGEAQSRAWAVESDSPHNENTPQYAEESDYLLYAHEIELRVDGSLDAIREIIKSIAAQHWYMKTRSMTVQPLEGDLPILAIDMRLTVFGLGLVPEPSEGEFAHSLNAKRIIY